VVDTHNDNEDAAKIDAYLAEGLKIDRTVELGLILATRGDRQIPAQKHQLGVQALAGIRR